MRKTPIPDLPLADPPPDTALGDAEDHAYFQAIEEIFVGLRGTPFLLAPADWQVARRWHRDGIPLPLVRRSLEEVFTRRRERRMRGKISSLRYCAPAVEAAWAEQRELTAPGRRSAPPPLDAAPRLAALAGALPAGFGGRERVVQALEELRELAAHQPPGPLAHHPAAVEERLAELDRALLAGALAELPAAARAALEEAVAGVLAGLAQRLPAGEIEPARERLRRQLLRQRLGLPVLSLFSPEAEPPTEPAPPSPASPRERGGAEPD